MSDAAESCAEKLETIKKMFVERTRDFGVPQLERLYARVMKGVFETKNNLPAGPGDNNVLLKSSILGFLLNFAENEANF